MAQNKLQVWDDGKHQNIVKISATVKEDKLTSIQFGYLESVGPRHGKADGDVKEVKGILWTQCCK